MSHCPLAHTAAASTAASNSSVAVYYPRLAAGVNYTHGASADTNIVDTTAVEWVGDTGSLVDVTSLILDPNLIVLMDGHGHFVGFNQGTLNTPLDVLSPNSLGVTSSSLAMNTTYNALMVRVFTTNASGNGGTLVADGDPLSNISSAGVSKVNVELAIEEATVGAATAGSQGINIFFADTVADAKAARQDYMVNQLASQGLLSALGPSLCIAAGSQMSLTTDSDSAVVGTTGGVLNLTLTVDGSKLLNTSTSTFGPNLAGSFVLSH